MECRLLAKNDSEPAVQVEESRFKVNHAFVSSLRRLYSVAPLIGGFVTTMSQVQYFGALNSTFVPMGLKYGYWVETISYDKNFVEIGSHYDSCGEGYVLSSTFNCPYFENPVYVAWQSVWIITWSTFILRQFISPLWYSTQDFRYYIYLEKIKAERMTRLFVAAVSIFTFASVLTSFYYSADNYQKGSLTYRAFVNQCFQQFVFIGVNMSATLTYVNCHYQHLREVSMAVQASPVMLKELVWSRKFSNLWGLLSSSDDLLRMVENSATATLAGSRSDPLSRLGDADELLGVCRRFRIIEESR